MLEPLGSPLGAPRLLGRVGTWARDRVTDWATASQARARRNALVASTACAQRRAERDDVAAYLEAQQTRHLERARGVTVSAPVRRTARS
jgi:hypothetical protein